MLRCGQAADLFFLCCGLRNIVSAADTNKPAITNRFPRGLPWKSTFNEARGKPLPLSHNLRFPQPNRLRTCCLRFITCALLGATKYVPAHFFLAVPIVLSVVSDLSLPLRNYLPLRNLKVLSTIPVRVYKVRYARYACAYRLPWAPGGSQILRWFATDQGSIRCNKLKLSIYGLFVFESDH